MKRNCHATAVCVAVLLVSAALGTQEKSITHEGTEDFPCREGAQGRPVDTHIVIETSGSLETSTSSGMGSPSSRSVCTTICTTSWMCLRASSAVSPHVAAPCFRSAGQYADHLSSSGSTTTLKM